MQYTFGDMIGELFMKALMLEEQRKVREEEKNYKNEVMQYQRGRDQIADQRYTSEQNINNQRYQDAQNYQGRQEERDIKRDKMVETNNKMNLLSSLIALSDEDIKALKFAPGQYKTGTAWEQDSGQDLYQGTDESLNYVLKTLYDSKREDKYRQETLNLDRQRIAAMYNSLEKQAKRDLENTYYKFNDFGEITAEWKMQPGYKTDWMKKNEEQYGGMWVKGSELNTFIGKKKLEKLNYAGPTAISDVTQKSLGNQYASKLFSLKNSPMDALLREFTPQLLSGGNNPQMRVMGLGGNNQYETQAANRQSWTNKMTSNTSFFTGLLNETLNPIAKLLNEASKFRNMNKESKKELNDLEITFGSMYPDLANLWIVLDKGLVNNITMENGKTLKENVYNAIQESKKRYNANKTLIDLATQRELENAMKKQQIKDAVTETSRQ